MFDFFVKNTDLCHSFKKNTIMSKICDITGKGVMVGNNVSKSNHKSKRKFYPNLQKKRFYVPETDGWITLKVSANGLRTINKKGIYACLQELEKKGEIEIIEAEK